MNPTRPGIVLCLALSATSVFAHDLFLEPEGYFVPPGAQVEAALFNGHFRHSENTIAGNRIAGVVLSGPDGKARLAWNGWHDAGNITRFRVQVGEGGTYALGVSTRPRPIELEGKSFNEYLEHDGIPDVLEARKRDGELHKPVVERYAKHVKTLMLVGASPGGGWEEPLGFPAELVPVTDPYVSEPGATLGFRVLVHGKPVANQLVIAGGVGSEGKFEERQIRSDADGVATFTFDRPGAWYVKFIHMVPSKEDGLDYESEWATLTFEIP